MRVRLNSFPTKAHTPIVGTMKIAVVLPTRGLVFTQVEQALELERLTHDIVVLRSMNKVLPDGHNELAKEAIDMGADYIWLVEEDTVPPIGGLDALIKADADIAAIDYGVNGYSCITRDAKTNEILWCAVGCTLVKRKVFEALEYPYFRSDKLLLLNFWPEIRWIDSGKQVYGGQDIWFCMKAREKGFTIKQVEGECKHLRLESLGRPEINSGFHVIGQKPVIANHQTL